jgi:hypothetical protein
MWVPGSGATTTIFSSGKSGVMQNSAFLGRIIGRYLPYAGTVVGAALTYGCMSSSQ